MERGHIAGWQALPNKVIGEASIYLDFRNSYRAAVAAGAIPDDRSGPRAA